MKRTAVLRFEDATWNISGLFTHDRALLFFYDLMQECGIPIEMAVHGNIPCAWNSGRIIRSVSEQYQRACLEAYAERGIPVFLTFSNYMITKSELDDTLSNRILELVAAYPHCGVIVGSSLIADYVRNRFPGLVLSTSILRAVHENGQGKPDYYTELARHYDRVVLHPDDGLNTKVIEQIQPKEKLEILVNENCVRNCSARQKHCDIVCRYYQSRRDSDWLEKLEMFKGSKCQSVQNIAVLRRYLKDEIKTCNMSYAELAAVYELGCRYFKIQGRSLSIASLFFDVFRYILQEEYASILYKVMMDRLDSFSDSQNDQVLTTDFLKWERI